MIEPKFDVCVPVHSCSRSPSRIRLRLNFLTPLTHIIPRRTKFVTLDKMDFVTGRRELEMVSEAAESVSHLHSHFHRLEADISLKVNYVKPTTIWAKVWDAVM